MKKNIFFITKLIFLISILLFILWGIYLSNKHKETTENDINEFETNLAESTKKEERTVTEFPYSLNSLEKKEENHIIADHDGIKMVYNKFIHDIGYTSFNITYPQIYGFSNKEFEISLNRKIKEICEKNYDILAEWYQEREKEVYEYTDDEDAIRHAMMSYYSCHTEYYLNGDILSIILNHEEFTGWLHSQNWTDTLNIDLKNNKLLELSDLISDKDGTQKILDEVNKQLAEKEYSYFDNADNKLKELQDPKVYIKNNLLILYYDPYQIASYASGPIELEMPFKFKNNLFIIDY